MVQSKLNIETTQTKTGETKRRRQAEFPRTGQVSATHQPSGAGAAGEAVEGAGETRGVGEWRQTEEGGSVAVPTSEVGLRGEGTDSGPGR